MSAEAEKFPWSGPLNEAGFPQDARDLAEADPEGGRAYIQALLEVSARDAKNYTLTATLEAGAIVFLLKDSMATVKTAGPFPSWIALLAVIALAASAASLYVFAIRINSRRAFIARTLATSDPVHARWLWISDEYGVRASYGRYRTTGFVLLGVGTVLLAITTGWLLIG